MLSGIGLTAGEERVRRIYRDNLCDLGCRLAFECEKEKIAFIPWFPLAAGRMAGSESPIAHIAAHLKATPSQVALAWLLARSPVMLPIPGTSKVKHLEENIAAAELTIETREMEELELVAKAS